MVFLIFIQDTFEVRFPLFSSFFTIFAIFAAWKLYVYSKKKSRVKELENYVKYLHWHRLENIKRIKHSLKVTKEQIEHITGLTLKNLVGELQKDNLNARTVLEAFTSKAIDATEKTNCVSEFLFDEALAMAETLDNLTEKERGPLHGVPFSVKEHFFIKGKDSTVGLYSRIGQPATENAQIIDLMVHLGAIPFCRTNMPQGVASFDCSNPIFGTTCHPKDPSRSPGGSTGGEGALIAMNGSIIGIGSDSGGSIRNPCHMCGIAGLKPTSGRLPLHGQASDGGLPGVPGGAINTSGFLTRTVEDLATIHEIVISNQNKAVISDPRFVPIPWNNDEKEGLKIGWYDYDGIFEATPGCRRAVRTAIEAAEKTGIKVIPFRPFGLREAFKLNSSYRWGDLGATKKAQLSIGPSSQISLGIKLLHWKLPWWIRFILGHAYRWTCSEILGSIVLPPSPLTTALDVWQLNIRRLELLRRILLDWEDAEVDVIIAPGFGVPALPIGYPGWLTAASSYTAVYNTLNFPVASMKVTEENEADQTALEENYPSIGDPKEIVYQWVKEGARGATKMPLNIQIIGRPWQEETVILAMKKLEFALNKN